MSYSFAAERSLVWRSIVAERLPDRKQEELLHRVMPHDLMRYGMIPELVGRLPIVAALNPLSLEDSEAILTKPKNALLKQYRKLCHHQGFDVRFTDCAVKAIAQCGNEDGRREREPFGQ